MRQEQSAQWGGGEWHRVNGAHARPVGSVRWGWMTRERGCDLVHACLLLTPVLHTYLF